MYLLEILSTSAQAMLSTAQTMLGTAPLVLFSRAVVASVWIVAVLDIWKHRDAPMANQAMAAALALIIGQFALIFSQHIPQETLFFFLAMGQVVMATAVMRIFRWTALIPDIHNHMQEAKVRSMKAQQEEGFRAFGRSFVVVAVVGVVYFLLTYVEMARHIG